MSDPLQIRVSEGDRTAFEARLTGPLLLILSRASTAMVQDGRGFDPVWEPSRK